MLSASQDTTCHVLLYTRAMARVRCMDCYLNGILYTARVLLRIHFNVYASGLIAFVCLTESLVEGYTTIGVNHCSFASGLCT